MKMGKGDGRSSESVGGARGRQGSLLGLLGESVFYS